MSIRTDERKIIRAFTEPIEGKIRNIEIEKTIP
jgi:hypothetical protein